MKKIFLLVLIFIFGISCENNDELTNTCIVSKPLEDLSWLQEKVMELEDSDSELKIYFYVSQAIYNEETVFIFPNCCPVCNTLVPVYNCEGELLGYIGDDNFDSSLLENDITIWKPQNFACS